MKQHQHGIALIESLIAVLILAIGLLGTIGLQARAHSALADSSMRAEATIATEKLLGIMANDQTNLSTYALASGASPSPSLAPWYAETRTNIPGANIAITISPVSGTVNRVDVTISWTRKAGGPTNQHLMTSYIAQSS